MPNMGKKQKVLFLLDIPKRAKCLRLHEFVVGSIVVRFRARTLQPIGVCGQRSFERLLGASLIWGSVSLKNRRVLGLRHAGHFCSLALHPFIVHFTLIARTTSLCATSHSIGSFSTTVSSSSPFSLLNRDPSYVRIDDGALRSRSHTDWRKIETRFFRRDTFASRLLTHPPW